MAKGKKGSIDNPISVKEIKKVFEKIVRQKRPFEIMEADIKDDFCNYKYEVIEDIGLGDTHKVDGNGIIEDDMRKAFAVFNVHLAVIDDVFKHSGIEIQDIDKLHGHDLTFLFNVTGFKIKGGKDNESIILIGNKYVNSAGGRLEVKSPRIPLDTMSSYKWYNELKAAAEKAREEVALYKEGKYTPVEVEEPAEDLKQTKISFDHPAEGFVDDFENAKV